MEDRFCQAGECMLSLRKIINACICFLDSFEQTFREAAIYVARTPRSGTLQSEPSLNGFLILIHTHTYTHRVPIPPKSQTEPHREYFRALSCVQMNALQWRRRSQGTTHTHFESNFSLAAEHAVHASVELNGKVRRAGSF